jgi:hypothetical protein
VFGGIEEMLLSMTKQYGACLAKKKEERKGICEIEKLSIMH